MEAIQRYEESPDYEGGYFMCPAPDGEWVKAADVLPALAVRDQLVAALKAFADLDKCVDQRDALAAFDAKHRIKPGEGRYTYLYNLASAALAAAGAA